MNLQNIPTYDQISITSIIDKGAYNPADGRS